MSKSILKNVVVVAAGVMLAGAIMNGLRGTGIIDQSRAGYN